MRLIKRQVYSRIPLSYAMPVSSNGTALSNLELGSRFVLMTRFGENTAHNCNTKDGSNLDSSQHQGTDQQQN